MYVIRYRDLKSAIDPSGKPVKPCDPNLWKPAWSEGTKDWQEGYEIRSNAIGISLFTAGSKEKPHYHERTWELYQVLEGSLKMAVKRLRKDMWTTVVLNERDMIILGPGTLHLVDSKSQHITQVIQAPRALSDQILINESREIEEAQRVLNGCMLV